MEKRGLTKSQIESKTTAVVLDIIANSGHKYTEIWEKEASESKKLNDLRRQVQGCENEIKYLKSLISKLEREEAEAEKHRMHCEDYIDEFNKSLMECESETDRDNMKAAQMFVNTVSVDTKYDNTAFIIGLASILSKGGINPISELKKINKKLPYIDNNFYWCDEGNRI